MRAIERTRHRIGGTAVIASLLLAAGAAQADTLWMEAEDLDEAVGQAHATTLTTPMRVVDRNDASGGSSIEVQNGLDSKTSAPALGRACYTFHISTAGTHRVWGRVIARTDADDSFWVRMDGGSWIKWNEIALGESWHWDFVHNDTNPTQPSTFSLAAGEHQLCVAYREDDTRLDVLVVTSDASFDPRAAISGPPAPPRNPIAHRGHLTLLVSWMTVLGATSYTLERSDDGGFNWYQVAANIAGHTYTDSSPEFTGTGHRYRLIAHGPTGTSSPSGADGQGICCFNFTDGMGAYSDAADLSLTGPMQVIQSGAAAGYIGAPTATESLNSVPATGWARLDFKLGSAGSLKAHVQVHAPNPDNDSFWVRMDQGAWIKWNNLVPHEPCDYDTVHDSDAGGATKVWSNLSAGSHTLEFAYREVGAAMNRVLLSSEPSAEDGYGLCFD
jgi:hypothetical protein